MSKLSPQYTIGKILKHKYQKWACNFHEIRVMAKRKVGNQKKKKKQVDSQPLKPINKVQMSS
jgi:hypothetical protein